MNNKKDRKPHAKLFLNNFYRLYGSIGMKDCLKKEFTEFQSLGLYPERLSEPEALAEEICRAFETNGIYDVLDSGREAVLKIGYWHIPDTAHFYKVDPPDSMVLIPDTPWHVWFGPYKS